MKNSKKTFIQAIDKNKKETLLQEHANTTNNSKSKAKQTNQSVEPEMIQPYVAPEPVIGIALGGGGALGIAHVGVLRVLQRNGIIPTKWAGTSMGAIVGAMYCNGVSLTKMKKIAKQLSVYHLLDFGIMSKGFLKGKRVERILKKYISAKTKFEDLKYEFKCNAVDLYTGKEVVLEQGNLLKSVRASFSVPVVFAPTKLDDMFLVDGGLLNNVPDDIVKGMGADLVIAVDVVNTYLQNSNIKTVADVMYRSALLIEFKLRELKTVKSDVIIAPKVEQYKQYVFNKKVAQELIALGEAAAKQALPQIEQTIAEWKQNYKPKGKPNAKPKTGANKKQNAKPKKADK